MHALDHAEVRRVEAAQGRDGVASRPAREFRVGRLRQHLTRRRLGVIEAGPIGLLQAAQVRLALPVRFVQGGIVRKHALGSLVQAQVVHALAEVLLERREFALALLPSGGDRDHRAVDAGALEGFTQIRIARLGAEDEEVGHPG